MQPRYLCRGGPENISLWTTECLSDRQKLNYRHLNHVFVGVKRCIERILLIGVNFSDFSAAASNKRVATVEIEREIPHFQPRVCFNGASFLMVPLSNSIWVRSLSGKCSSNTVSHADPVDCLVVTAIFCAE